MDNSAHLIWSIILGGIGLGFFTYGRKQKSVIPFFVGIALFIIPYFISNSLLLVLAATALIILAYFIKL